MYIDWHMTSNSKSQLDGRERKYLFGRPAIGRNAPAMLATVTGYAQVSAATLSEMQRCSSFKLLPFIPFCIVEGASHMIKDRTHKRANETYSARSVQLAYSAPSQPTR